MRYTLALLSLFCLSAYGLNLSQVQQLIDQGHYRQARAAIQQAQANSPAPEQQLAFELERMRRIEGEFSLNEKQLKASLARYLPSVTDTQFRQWLSQGRFEYKDIDGERRYFARAAYNLFQTDDAARALIPGHQRFTDKAPLYWLHPHHQAVLQAETPPSRQFEVTYSLTVKADAVPAGERVRVWLPFPQVLPGEQTGVQLLGTSHSDFQLAPNGTPQRTLYMEAMARAGEPTRFSQRYRFVSHAKGATVDAAAVEPLAPADPARAWLGERAPHIQFTPALKALSAKLVGLESNPYRIAQRLFAHVDSIPWASAREYSTIRNISDYAHRMGHADCGQQTLLLITLLRLNGIPARWQSGWEFGPGEFDTMHDWGEFYLPPYGWLPMDVTHGQLASEDPALRWFYLGRLDAYRLIFNTDYSRPLVPAKQHIRSETVDSQRGEVEWRGGNLYFDQWHYAMDWRLVE